MEVSHTPVDIPTPRDVWTALNDLPQRVNSLAEEVRIVARGRIRRLRTRTARAVRPNRVCGHRRGARPPRCGPGIRVHRRPDASPGLSLRPDLPHRRRCGVGDAHVVSSPTRRAGGGGAGAQGRHCRGVLDAARRTPRRDAGLASDAARRRGGVGNARSHAAVEEPRTEVTIAALGEPETTPHRVRAGPAPTPAEAPEIESQAERRDEDRRRLLRAVSTPLRQLTLDPVGRPAARSRRDTGRRAHPAQRRGDNGTAERARDRNSCPRTAQAPRTARAQHEHPSARTARLAHTVVRAAETGPDRSDRGSAGADPARPRREPARLHAATAQTGPGRDHWRRRARADPRRCQSPRSADDAEAATRPGRSPRPSHRRRRAPRPARGLGARANPAGPGTTDSAHTQGARSARPRHARARRGADPPRARRVVPESLRGGRARQAEPNAQPLRSDVAGGFPGRRRLAAMGRVRAPQLATRPRIRPPVTDPRRSSARRADRSAAGAAPCARPRAGTGTRIGTGPGTGTARARDLMRAQRPHPRAGERRRARARGEQSGRGRRRARAQRRWGSGTLRRE